MYETELGGSKFDDVREHFIRNLRPNGTDEMNNRKIDEIDDERVEHFDRTKRYISSGSNRKVPHVLFVETAIFVDRDLFRHMAKNYPKNTEGNLIRFVMAMINGVQLLYHHPSLGHQINFILKRLEILHNDPKELRRSSDIDIFLNSFCMWQRKFNPIADDNIFHFDHAVILTGDLHQNVIFLDSHCTNVNDSLAMNYLAPVWCSSVVSRSRSVCGEQKWKN